MKYLITGGAGFIGSHLSEKLLSLNHEVVALDDLSTGSMANIRTFLDTPSFKFIEGSILDQDLLDNLVKNCDGIFHLAAAVGVKKILTEPIQSMKTNLEGTENILFSATRNQKRILIASTSEIYGKNDHEPLTEESDRVLGSPLTIRWTYSEAKAIDEAIARILYEKEDLKVQIIRFFNTVGPRQSSAYGMAIPTFMRAAINGEPLTIHGDGLQKRVFCHVNDAINGVIALWNSDDGYGEAFNLGGIEETTILNLVKRILVLTKSSSEVKHITYDELARSGFEDMRRRIPVTEKLSKLTGWQANENLQSILNDVLTHELELKID